MHAAKQRTNINVASTGHCVGDILGGLHREQFTKHVLTAYRGLMVRHSLLLTVARAILGSTSSMEVSDRARAQRKI